jgi:hypothetical protein
LIHGWDGQVYYAAARSLVVGGDLDISDDLPLTPGLVVFDQNGDGTLENVPHRSDGRIVNVFPMGMSLLEVPWLWTGRTLRRLIVFAGVQFPQADGYSPLEVNTVAVGLLVYFCAGVQLLYSLLLDPEVRTFARLPAVFGTWAGTPLLYYSTVFPFMAHAMGFVLVVAAACVSGALAKRMERGDRSTILYGGFGLLVGAIFLVRPQQVLFPAFLTANPRLHVRSRPGTPWVRGAALALLVFSLLVLLQGFVYRDATGTFALDAHSVVAAGFDWLHPHFYQVLGLPARGLLWICPVVLLAAFGVAAALRRGTALSWTQWSLMLNAVVQVYAIASWSDHVQGDAFGPRMWIECTPAVAVGLLLLYQERAIRWAAVAATLLCTLWTTGLLALYILGRLPLNSGRAETLAGLL